MRTILLLSICLLAASQQYDLVWSDEFDGTSLDLKKWGYEVNCDGGGNNELQCYTTDAKNIAVRNGNLVITAIPQNLNGKQYSSGRITTSGKASWKYGRFDIRAKLPNGPYLWPALWMMPQNNVYGWWAASGEIDIMEARGQFPTKSESTLHHGGSWPNNIYTGSGPYDVGVDLTADFHIYTCIWTESSIQFLVDGKLYHTQSLERSFWSGRGANPYTANRQPFDQHFFFIINLAVGGGFFGPDANKLTVQDAQRWNNPSFFIDYVRVYQLSNKAVNTPPAPVPIPVPVPSSSTTPAATSSNNGGCAQGQCGGSACCNDQTNGVQCYNPSLYSCTLDGATGKYGLCQAGMATCRGGCYNPQTYSCINGWLQPGGVPAASKSSTVAAAPSTSSVAAAPSTSSVAAAPRTSTVAAPAPSSGNVGKACPNGCGANACCNGVCYFPGQYTCAPDPLGSFQICSIGTKACATACYNPSSYRCGASGLELIYK